MSCVTFEKRTFTITLLTIFIVFSPFKVKVSLQYPHQLISYLLVCIFSIYINALALCVKFSSILL
jgi:hypothetical protein